MERLKKWGVFLVLLALVGSGAALLFWDLGAECLSVLRTGTGQTQYLLTAADAEGNIYALGRSEEGYELVLGDADGRRTDRWTLTAEGLPQESWPAAVYPASGGAVYLGLYQTEGAETHLQLYRLTDQGRTAELLLDEPCQGESLPEQMDSLRFSAFSEVDSVVTFAVIEGDTARFYQRTSASSGLELLQEVTEPGLHTAMALSDGSVVLAAGEGLVRTGGETIALEGNETVIRLLQAGTGIYYVDGASLAVFYADYADWRPYSFLELSKDAYDLDACTDLWVTRNGDALLLMDGQRLLMDRGSTVSDLTGLLYRPASQCVLILLGLVLGVLAVTTLLWYLVCEERRFRLPMLVRWGVLLAAAAALGVAALLRWGVAPAAQAAVEREAAGLLGSVTAQVLQESTLAEEDLPERLGNSLAGAAGGAYRDTAVSVYQQDGAGTWTLVGSNGSLPAGTRAELSPSFDRAQAERAAQEGAALWTRAQGGQRRCLLYQWEGGLLLAVDTDLTALLEAGEADYQWMVQGFTALAVLLTALSLAILCWITIGLRRALNGMERMAAGERGVRVALGGGDELASLADDINAFSDTLQELDRAQNELAQSYRRFVPERVLSLLGKTSIAEVDKQTFVSRHLATMMLSFHFPPQVYGKSGRELFDNINEIIGRTASIVTQKGGAVFNFAYNGYDAVFEEGSAAAVSTAVAVQQAVLEINKEREVDGRSPVVMRIALDEGNVMLGVVGDEDQIEPTSISSSFSITKHLMALCGRLEANILCTEAVVEAAERYGSRYMGKCREGGETVRIYEIFDGDPYDIRKVKESTGSLFSEGVYALYSRDFSRAKRIFLTLVHHNTGDGGARYYLYLADRLEKRPEEDITLDSGG